MLNIGRYRRRMSGGLLKHIDAYEIQQYQQNRYPLLFVDMIEEAEPGKYAKGYKNFTYNEWFFPAHFEDEPNVPGFVQLEVMTQIFLMSFLTLPEYKGKKTAFLGVNNLRFRKKIIPGDRLDVEAKLMRLSRGIAKGTVYGSVAGEYALSAELEIGIPDIIRSYLPKV